MIIYLDCQLPDSSCANVCSKLHR